jgi:formate/nitrite transporter FocA (FNT family)
MAFAVDFARYAEREVYEHFSNWLPLLFAVPAFILCGFPHCVADAFYSLVYIFNTPICTIPWGDLAAYYGSIVLGNFVGCNVYRLLGF